MRAYSSFPNGNAGQDLRADRKLIGAGGPRGDLLRGEQRAVAPAPSGSSGPLRMA